MQYSHAHNLLINQIFPPHLHKCPHLKETSLLPLLLMYKMKRMTVEMMNNVIAVRVMVQVSHPKVRKRVMLMNRVLKKRMLMKMRKFKVKGT